MGLITRLQRVTMARIESFLDTAEDPELIFPRLVSEMEEQVRAATNAEAKAMGAVKSAQRNMDEIRGRLERLQKGAEIALKQGDEATAREALSAQVSAEDSLRQHEESFARSEKARESATEARKHLQEQLRELQAKKNEILTRARVAKSQKNVQKTVGGPVNSSKSILDSVSKMESKIHETEAELDVQRELTGGSAGPSLDRKLKNLELNAEVEARLAKLQRKTGKSGK